MSDIINNYLIELKKKKNPNPELDLKILLSFSSYKKKNIFLSNLDLNDINIDYFHSLVLKRLNDQPISKIINLKSFWKSDFYVNFNVLDPRPETELIIEESLSNYKNKKEDLKILDIGTGSGCLSISLAKEFPNSSVTAIDISKKALRVAKKNIMLNKVENQINLKLSEFSDIKEKFDIIVSNPPYLSKEEYRNVQNEIKKYEPKVALLGGDDGLKFYNLFAEKVENLMNKNSHLIIEIGQGQLNHCKTIFKNTNLKLKKISKDIQKIDRTLTFIKI